MTERISLEGKVAVVTGAGRGLGRAYVELLAEAHRWTHHPTVPRSTQAQLLDGLSAPGRYGHLAPARPQRQAYGGRAPFSSPLVAGSP
jgi:NAD(P)-dependent dehydrogenase (short-subunit alcohol dehydrogenase family)